MTEPTSSTKDGPIRGRVAAILNARELVINRGSEAGVGKGMRFAVLAATPLEIKDPDTGEVLDEIDREKVRVEVGEVRPRTSICRTYIVRTVGGGPAAGFGVTAKVFSTLFEEPRRKVETLEIKDSTLPPPLPEEESFVKVNDRVIQVEWIEGEDDDALVR